MYLALPGLRTTAWASSIVSVVLLMTTFWLPSVKIWRSSPRCVDLVLSWEPLWKLVLTLQTIGPTDFENFYSLCSSSIALSISALRFWSFIIRWYRSAFRKWAPVTGQKYYCSYSSSSPSPLPKIWRSSSEFTLKGIWYFGYFIFKEFLFKSSFDMGLFRLCILWIPIKLAISAFISSPSNS